MASRPLPDSIPPDLLPRLAERLHGLPMLANLGFTVMDIGPGWARLHIPADPATVNLEGVVSGGILATAVDVACAMALSTAFDGDMPFATADLHIRYLEPASGDVEVQSEVVRLSGRSAVLQSRLVSTKGVTVAIATCQFTILRRWRD